MNNVLENYQMAILCAVLVAILALLQSLAGAAFKFGPGKGVAGVPLGGSHDSLPFRMERSHLNMAENIGMFTLTLGLAILVGVDPTWVNWSAVIFLVARTAHWVMYAAGISKIRTMFFAIGIFATLILAIKTVITIV